MYFVLTIWWAATWVKERPASADSLYVINLTINDTITVSIHRTAMHRALFIWENAVAFLSREILDELGTGESSCGYIHECLGERHCEYLRDTTAGHIRKIGRVE